MSKRLGILTGGGDCPGLNAVIRAVVKHARGTHGWDVVGIEDGFEGLVERRIQPLPAERVRGLLVRGGTILGSSNRGNPFSYPVPGSNEVRDVSDDCIAYVRELGLDALIVVGGDGSLGIACQLAERGVPVIGVPKTIDNDLDATDYTFGYQTAVAIATEAIDRLHTTAESHDRVIICEVMGRYAGWIAMAAGMAGGADVILIPEIEYDIDRVVQCFHRRSAAGVRFSIVAIAEGARPRGGGFAVVRRGDPTQLEKLGGAGARLADELRAACDYDVRVTVLGHVQRGGTPTAFDRLLGTRYGVAAVELAAAGRFGECVCLRGTRIEAVPLAAAVAKLKRVDPSGQLVAAARATGVEMGA